MGWPFQSCMRELSASSLSGVLRLQEATVTATELQTHCQDLRTWLLWVCSRSLCFEY
jgi:hypothetical protein